MFSEILQRFMQQRPVPVMVQALLEQVLSPHKLDAWFARTAVDQYTRKLLFSTLFKLMNSVVFKTHSSMNAAYKEEGGSIGVSITSAYNKLNGLESTTSAALVRDTARDMAGIIEKTGGGCTPWLPDYRIKVLDGNCIEATEHRLNVLRETNAIGVNAIGNAIGVRYCGTIGVHYWGQHYWGQSRFGAIGVTAVL